MIESVTEMGVIDDDCTVTRGLLGIPVGRSVEEIFVSLAIITESEGLPVVWNEDILVLRRKKHLPVVWKLTGDLLIVEIILGLEISVLVEKLVDCKLSKP